MNSLTPSPCSSHFVRLFSGKTTHFLVWRTGMKFNLGACVATPGALDAFTATGEQAIPFLRRHASGDWGDLDEEDKAENEYSLTHGLRLLSAYHLSDGTKIW